MKPPHALSAKKLKKGVVCLTLEVREIMLLIGVFTIYGRVQNRDAE